MSLTVPCDRCEEWYDPSDGHACDDLLNPLGTSPVPAEEPARHGAQGDPATPSSRVGSETAAGSSVTFRERQVAFEAPEYDVLQLGSRIGRLRWAGDRYTFWPGVGIMLATRELDRIARKLTEVTSARRAELGLA